MSEAHRGGGASASEPDADGVWGRSPQRQVQREAHRGGGASASEPDADGVWGRSPQRQVQREAHRGGGASASEPDADGRWGRSPQRQVQPNGAGRDSLAGGRVALVRFHGYDPSTRREAEALREAGMEVYVLCLAGQTEIDGAVHRPLEVVDGVHVRRFRISKRRGGPATYAWQWGCWFVACFVALTVLHARRRLRVIQVSSLPDFQVFAALVPKLTGCRVVFFQKEPFPELFATITGRTTLSKLLAVVERLAIRFADRTLTVTEQLRQTSVARGADGNRIGVVLNATPRAAWAPAVARSAAHDGEFVVLCAGTIEERYGHVHLAEAVAIARRSLPNIRLVVTGSGTAVPAFQARVSALGIDDCVDYLGWVSDAVLAEQFARADVGVVAQLANSYSHLVHTTKMFEYFEAGIPVIASRLRATARSYGEDTIAYYEPGDAADLARRLVELGSDPARCRDLADHGHAAIARDGWPEQAKRYVGAFAEVLGAIPAPVG